MSEQGPADSEAIAADDERWLLGLPDDAPPASRIEALRRIIERKGFGKIDGTIVDTYTAQMLVALYDAFQTPEARLKFEQLPLLTVVAFGWKQTRRAQ